MDTALSEQNGGSTINNTTTDVNLRNKNFLNKKKIFFI